MSDEQEIAWVEGKIVPAREARVPVLDHGFLYGDGIFEGIRVTPAGIFRFDDHMRRFETASRAVGIAVAGGMDRVREVARETTRAWGPRAGYLRLILTRGIGGLGLDPASCDESTVVCIAAGMGGAFVQKARCGR